MVRNELDSRIMMVFLNESAGLPTTHGCVDQLLEDKRLLIQYTAQVEQAKRYTQLEACTDASSLPEGM